MNAFNPQVLQLRILFLEFALASHAEPTAGTLALLTIDLGSGLVRYNPLLVYLKELVVTIPSVLLMCLQVIVDEQQVLICQLQRNVDSALVGNLVHEAQRHRLRLDVRYEVLHAFTRDNNEGHGGEFFSVHNDELILV